MAYEHELQKLTPPDFDLSHYAGTATLDAHGWLACLWSRFKGDVLGNGHIHEPDRIQWRDPLNCELPDEILDYESENLTSVNFLDYEPIINTQYSSKTFYTHLSIDLDMCDNFLIEDFKTELKLARNRAGITARTRMISESEFDNWHKARVLQYLDIRHWHESKGLKATLDEVGDILFPKNDTGATGDRVRRTVLKHLKTVTSRETIISLLAQIYKLKKQHEKIEKS